MLSTWVSSVAFQRKRSTTTWAAPARAQPARRGKPSRFSPEQLHPRRWQAETELSSSVTSAPRLHLPTPLQEGTRGARGCARAAAGRGLTRVVWHNFCVLGGPKFVSHPSAIPLEATFASCVFPSRRHMLISQLLISSAVSIALCHLFSIITPRIDILFCKSSRIPTLGFGA